MEWNIEWNEFLLCHDHHVTKKSTMHGTFQDIECMQLVGREASLVYNMHASIKAAEVLALVPGSSILVLQIWSTGHEFSLHGHKSDSNRPVAVSYL